MANKRALTGGTDDVNPQWLSHNFTGVLPVAPGTIGLGETVTLPVYPLGAGTKERATVLEVFAIEVMMDAPFQQPGGPVNAQTEFRLKLGASQTDPVAQTFTDFMRDPGALFLSTRHYTMGNAAGNWAGANDPALLAWRFDLGDRAGHGVLWAAQTITFQLYVENSVTPFWQPSPAIVSVSWRMLYRFKSVGLTEYIGIVQSQQS